MPPTTASPSYQRMECPAGLDSIPGTSVSAVDAGATHWEVAAICAAADVGAGSRHSTSTSATAVDRSIEVPPGLGGEGTDRRPAPGVYYPGNLPGKNDASHVAPRAPGSRLRRRRVSHVRALSQSDFPEGPGAGRPVRRLRA